MINYLKLGDEGFCMRKGWLIILLLILVAGSVYAATLPRRCTFDPRILCEDLYVDKENNQLLFTFRNYLGMSAEFNFSARENDKNTSVKCACNGMPTCAVENSALANVTCVFPEKTLKKDRIRFDIDAYYMRLDKVYWIPIKGEIYWGEYTSNPRATLWLGLIIGIVVVTLIFVFLLLRLNKGREKFKRWWFVGLKTYLITTFVVFILINFILELGLLYAPKRILDALYFSVIGLGVSIAVSLPLGLIVLLVSYYKNRGGNNAG